MDTYLNLAEMPKRRRWPAHYLPRIGTAAPLTLYASHKDILAREPKRPQLIIPEAICDALTGISKV